jgi:WD40 repeat protein
MNPIIMETFDKSPKVTTPSTSYFVAPGPNHHIHLWDAETHEKLGALVGHSSHIDSIVISPDGSKLASSSFSAFPERKGTIIVWNMDTMTELMQFTRKDPVMHHSLCFSKDGEQLLATYRDATVVLWNLMKKQEQLSIKPQSTRFGHLPCNAVFSYNDDKIITVGVRDDHDDLIHGTYTTTNDDDEVTYHRLNSLIVHDASTGKQMTAFTCPSTNDISHLVVNPVNDTVAAKFGTQCDHVKIFNTTTGKVDMTIGPIEHGTTHLCFNGSGDLLATVGIGGEVLIWSTMTRELLYTIATEAVCLYSLAFSTDSSHIACGMCSDEHAIVIYDIPTGEPIREFSGTETTNRCVCYSSPTVIIL